MSEDIRKYIDELFKQISEQYTDKELNEEELTKMKMEISEWFIQMYEKDSDVLKQMAKSDDLLKMIQREFRFSKLLD